MAALDGRQRESCVSLSHLFKELALSQSQEQLERVAHIPKLHQHLQKRLYDIAFGHLLGFEEVRFSVITQSIKARSFLTARFISPCRTLHQNP